MAEETAQQAHERWEEWKADEIWEDDSQKPITVIYDEEF